MFLRAQGTKAENQGWHVIKGITDRSRFAIVGMWNVLAHICHLRLVDLEKALRSIASFQAMLLSSLLKLLHDEPQ